MMINKHLNSRNFTAFTILFLIGLLTACSDSNNESDLESDSSTDRYEVGGFIDGLEGTVQLKLNDAETLSISISGQFTFVTTITEGSGYTLAIADQPSNQSCQFINGQATEDIQADILNVSIECDNLYSVDGNVENLQGTLQISLNGFESLYMTSTGSFGFQSLVPEGGAYLITIAYQPKNQTCHIIDGSGGNVINDITIDIVCDDAVPSLYSIGGSVDNLQGTLDLEINGAEVISIAIAGVFTFVSEFAEGTAYTVTIIDQPADQLCQITSGQSLVSINENVSDILVECIDLYKVEGTIDNLQGTVDLQLNGVEILSIASSGSFEFSSLLAEGSAYSITVAAQPANQSCQVTSGSGTAEDNVQIEVDCEDL